MQSEQETGNLASAKRRRQRKISEHGQPADAGMQKQRTVDVDSASRAQVTAEFTAKKRYT